MKTFKILAVFCIAISTLNSCKLFRNYTTITTKPDRFFSNKIIEQDTSLIAFDLKVNYKSIEQKVNQLFSNPFTGSESGEFDQQYRAKTKNPAYNPVEWIKTRNPLYNPRKWIKIKIFGRTIKTKNPAYNPKKWLTTKNPLYDPNEWIYADAVRIQIGYKYEFSVQKRGNISFQSIGNNTLRITIPLDVKGTVGFKGDGARLLGLNKKNVKTKVDFYIDTKIGFNNQWCPLVNAKINHTWVSDPKIEIAGGVWLNLRLPASLALNTIENDIEKDIATKIDCTPLQNEIKKWIKPSSFQLTNFSDQLYVNIDPKNFYLSDLLVTASDLNIKFASKLVLGVSTKKLFDNASSTLPPLEKYAFKENLIALTVPLSIEYKALEDHINTILKDKELKYEKNKTKIKVNEFEMYPSGEALTIGIDLSAKLPGKLFSTKGKIYLTAKPHIENKEFELQNISFSTQLDNKIYPLIGAVFKNKLIDYIYTNTKRDLKKEFHKAETIIETQLKKQLQKVNHIDVTVEDIALDIPYIAIQEKEFVVPVRLATGVEINVQNIWK